MKTVLMVDDHESVRTLVRDYLTQEGMRVVEAHDGRAALLKAHQEHPDIILLDIMMPEMNGFDFIRAFRKECNTPIILLTSKLEESDTVLELELGADDYVTKPFSPRALVARIHAVLRRVEGPEAISSPDVLRGADVVLERAAHSVTVADRPVSLTPSEFELLAVLLATPGRVFTRAQLLERLQGEDGESVERTIDVHIRNLRAKIEPTHTSPRYIETVFGVGYRFRADGK